MRLCFPLGIGFWVIAPSAYSLAGFVSGKARKSSRARVLGLSVVATMGISPTLGFSILVNAP